MAMGMRFGCCDSLRYYVSSLLVSLGIYVELGHEYLEIMLVLDGKETIPEFIIQD